MKRTLREYMYCGHRYLRVATTQDEHGAAYPPQWTSTSSSLELSSAGARPNPGPCPVDHDLYLARSLYIKSNSDFLSSYNKYIIHAKSIFYRQLTIMIII